MADVITFPGRRRSATAAQSVTLDQRVAELNRQLVPADRRDSLGRLLGQFAKAVGPTPKKGAKRMFERAELMSCYDKRKRLIVLEGEAPDIKPRSAWSEYFRLAKAAAALRHPEDESRRRSTEALYLRKMVDAGTVGGFPEPDSSALDETIFSWASRILSRVHADVPELDHVRRLSLVAPAHAEISGCSVYVPLGALEWSVEIDAFRFPSDLVRQCPRILLGGKLWWEDPDQDEQAAVFDAWLSQFNSPIGLPEVGYDPALGYGWDRQTVKAYEPVSLIIRAPHRLLATALGLTEQSNAWDVAVELTGLTHWQPVLSGRRSNERSSYVEDMVAGRDVSPYREDDFTFPVDEFWGTDFAAIHCIAPEARQLASATPSKAYEPFIIDANDPILESLSGYESVLLLENGRSVEARLLDIMRSRWVGQPPKFVPQFSVDENEPVPAPEGGFVAAILRNMSHAGPGSRLDDIAVEAARAVAEDVARQLQAAAALVEKYRDGIAEW